MAGHIAPSRFACIFGFYPSDGRMVTLLWPMSRGPGPLSQDMVKINNLQT